MKKERENAENNLWHPTSGRNHEGIPMRIGRGNAEPVLVTYHDLKTFRYPLGLEDTSADDKEVPSIEDISALEARINTAIRIKGERGEYKEESVMLGWETRRTVRIIGLPPCDPALYMQAVWRLPGVQGVIFEDQEICVLLRSKVHA